jgi:hypothetical protein
MVTRISGKTELNILMYKKYGGGKNIVWQISRYSDCHCYATAGDKINVLSQKKTRLRSNKYGQLLIPTQRIHRYAILPRQRLAKRRINPLLRSKYWQPLCSLHNGYCCVF